MSFARPTLTELAERVRSDVEANMTEVPVVRRGSVLWALARGLAGASHGVHGHADWIFDQIFPDTAESAQLERMAGFYDIARADPAPATGDVGLTGTDGTVIPAGTEFAHVDGLTFVTTEAAVIAGGVAVAPVQATEAGAAGNLDEAEDLNFLSPVAGADEVASVAAPGFANGADAETDARLLERLLLRLRLPPHGGAAHDYVQWALETPGVTRVWAAQEAGLGTVTVRFTVDDAPHGPAPNAGEIAAVQSYIDARRPVTAQVFVVAPILAPIDVTLSVTPDTPEVRASIEASLEELIRREAEPGGAILISHIREAISIAAGESDHVLAAPVADVVNGAGEMAVLGVVTFT